MAVRFALAVFSLSMPGCAATEVGTAPGLAQTRELVQATARCLVAAVGSVGGGAHQQEAGDPFEVQERATSIWGSEGTTSGPEQHLGDDLGAEQGEQGAPPPSATVPQDKETKENKENKGNKKNKANKENKENKQPELPVAGRHAVHDRGNPTASVEGALGMCRVFPVGPVRHDHAVPVREPAAEARVHNSKVKGLVGGHRGHRRRRELF